MFDYSGQDSDAVRVSAHDRTVGTPAALTRHRGRLWQTLAVAAACVWIVGCAPEPDLVDRARRAAAAEVFDRAALDGERLRAHASFLADAALAGRYPGTPGIDAAEEYIRRRFAAIGAISPPDLDHHAHEVRLFASDCDHDGTGVTVRADGLVVATADAPLSMRPLPVSDLGSAEGELVYVGYGITAVEHGWDDYRGVDATGRIALMLRYEPGAFDRGAGFGGEELTDYSLFTTKADTARRHGAIGMIVVTGPAHGDEPEDLRTPQTLALEPRPIASRWARTRMAGFLAAQIDRSAADDLLATAGLSVVELQGQTDAGLSPASVDLSGLVARITVEAAESVPVAARNIVGLLPAEGSAGLPGGEQEWIVIGAHHDHLGSFAEGVDSIYYGADDNASGVAGLLELGAALSGTDRGVGIALVAFTAEEQGLLGSRAFVADGVIPTDRIALMINLDMIGRNPDQPVRVYTSASADGFADAVERAAATHGLDVSMRRGVVEAVSDHYPFHRAGVPVVSVFTGLHDDYHRVTDTADRLDYDRMGIILSVVFDAIAEIAGVRGSSHEVASRLSANAGFLIRATDTLA